MASKKQTPHRALLILAAAVVLVAVFATACDTGTEIRQPASTQANTATSAATGNRVSTQPSQTQPAESAEATSAAETEPESITVSQNNALRSAKNYLDVMPFSYTGLIEQLEYEQYSTEDATYAADHCGADWNEQALRKAKSYLDTMAFSYDGLLEQLAYEGFTAAEAAYGVDNCEADWNEQAALKAKSYLELMAFSKDGLVSQLEFEGFTHEQAVYGAEQNGL